MQENQSRFAGLVFSFWSISFKNIKLKRDFAGIRMALTPGGFKTWGRIAKKSFAIVFVLGPFFSTHKKVIGNLLMQFLSKKQLKGKK